MSEIYVVVPKGTNLLPAHTTWQGAAMELADLGPAAQRMLEVQNTDLIEDAEG